jgi:histidine triad (HIT) family protein
MPASWHALAVRECVFCAIVGGAAAVRVYEDTATLAFLDARPLFPGHTLVIPREHTETLGDLRTDSIGPYFTAVQRVSGAVERGLGAGGTFVAINNKVSQSVPHLHCHVVPRTKGDGLRGFFWPRGRYANDEEAEAFGARIRQAI